MTKDEKLWLTDNSKHQKLSLDSEQPCSIKNETELFQKIIIALNFMRYEKHTFLQIAGETW